MDNKPTLQPELIQIVDFRIIKGEIDSPFEFDEELVKGHTFSVNFDLGFKPEEKLVRADFNVEIQTSSEGEQEQEARGMFSFAFIFLVENLDQLIKPVKGKGTEVSGELGNALASITYSTARGILMARFKGTALEHFILPVINPNDLLEKQSS